MKTISILIMAGVLLLMPATQAQDAAMEEKLNKLNGYVQDLIAAQKVQQERIAALAKEIESVREQASKPVGNFASPEDLRTLAEKLQEIDQKRVADNERILKEIAKLGQASAATGGKKPAKPASATVVDSPSGNASAEKGFEYEIQSGDTISTIAQAYREKGIKISSDQILKANPGMKPNSLRVGQKIFIPAPAP